MAVIDQRFCTWDKEIPVFLSLMEPFFSLFKDVCGQRNHKIWGRTDNKIPCYYNEEHISVGEFYYAVTDFAFVIVWHVFKQFCQKDAME